MTLYDQSPAGQIRAQLWEAVFTWYMGSRFASDDFTVHADAERVRNLETQLLMLEGLEPSEWAGTLTVTARWHDVVLSETVDERFWQARISPFEARQLARMLNRAADIAEGK